MTDAFFVISTPQDDALSARLRALADAHRFLLCTIDQPRYGFVAMQAIVTAGPVRIGISTGGVAPRVGKALKTALQRVLDAKFARFVDCLATQKRRNRTRLAGRRQSAPPRDDRRAERLRLEMRASYPQWFEDEFAAWAPNVETVPE